MLRIKKKKNIKFYTLEQTFKKRTDEFKQGYKEESSRIMLAKEIRTIRSRKKMTQKDVAQKADIPQSVIARLESGNHSVSLYTLNRIAYVLGKRVQLV